MRSGSLVSFSHGPQIASPCRRDRAGGSASARLVCRVAESDPRLFEDAGHTQHRVVPRYWCSGILCPGDEDDRGPCVRIEVVGEWAASVRSRDVSFGAPVALAGTQLPGSQARPGQRLIIPASHFRVDHETAALTFIRRGRHCGLRGRGKCLEIACGSHKEDYYHICKCLLSCMPHG